MDSLPPLAATFVAAAAAMLAGLAALYLALGIRPGLDKTVARHVLKNVAEGELRIAHQVVVSGTTTLGGRMLAAPLALALAQPSSPTLAREMTERFVEQRKALMRSARLRFWLPSAVAMVLAGIGAVMGFLHGSFQWPLSGAVGALGVVASAGRQLEATPKRVRQAFDALLEALERNPAGPPPQAPTRAGTIDRS